MKFTHDQIERKPWLLIVLVILVVSIGGLVEIVPLFFQKSTTEPVAGLTPYGPLRLAGRGGVRRLRPGEGAERGGNVGAAQ